MTNSKQINTHMSPPILGLRIQVSPYYIWVGLMTEPARSGLVSEVSLELHVGLTARDKFLNRQRGKRASQETGGSCSRKQISIQIQIIVSWALVVRVGPLIHFLIQFTAMKSNHLLNLLKSARPYTEMNGRHSLAPKMRQECTVRLSEQCGNTIKAASSPGEAAKRDSAQENRDVIPDCN